MAVKSVVSRADVTECSACALDRVLPVLLHVHSGVGVATGNLAGA